MAAWRKDNWPSMFRFKVKTVLNSAGAADGLIEINIKER